MKTLPQPQFTMPLLEKYHDELREILADRGLPVNEAELKRLMREMHLLPRCDMESPTELRR